MKYHLTLVITEWLLTTRHVVSARKAVKEKQPLHTACWWECKQCKPVWWFRKKLGTELTYDPSSWDLPQNLKTFVLKDTCTLMFTVSLFAVAKTWKPPTCPLKDGWIKKMWYTYNRISFGRKKR